MLSYFRKAMKVAKLIIKYLIVALLHFYAKPDVSNVREIGREQWAASCPNRIWRSPIISRGRRLFFINVRLFQIDVYIKQAKLKWPA